VQSEEDPESPSKLDQRGESPRPQHHRHQIPHCETTGYQPWRDNRSRNLVRQQITSPGETIGYRPNCETTGYEPCYPTARLELRVQGLWTVRVEICFGELPSRLGPGKAVPSQWLQCEVNGSNVCRVLRPGTGTTKYKGTSLTRKLSETDS
jgi:hypothetical protein